MRNRIEEKQDERGGRSSVENINRRDQQFLRHQQLMEIYKREETNNVVNEEDEGLLQLEDVKALERNHQFVRDDEEDERLMNRSWEVRMARKYYNRLFKEYAVGDFSRYEEGKIGLRWRVEKEVMNGKGQFTCGSLTCSASNDLNSYEVPFRYKEGGVIKHELVKIRVCEECAIKLFYKKLQSAPLEKIEKVEEVEEEKRKKKKSKKSKSKSKKRKERKNDTNEDEDEHEVEENDGEDDRQRRKERRREEESSSQVAVRPTNSTREIFEVQQQPQQQLSISTTSTAKDTFGMEDYLKELFF